MKKVLAFIIIVLILAGGGYYYLSHRGDQKLSAGMISAKLENASDCTTQRLIYNGCIPSESGTVPIINKKTFLMTYVATINAGFDISKTEIDLTDDQVVVTIPPMEVQGITIDPHKLEFYNTSLTIFKPDGQKETKAALIKAEEDAKSKIADSGLLEAAAVNAESLIRGILEDSIGDRELVIKHAE